MQSYFGIRTIMKRIKAIRFLLKDKEVAKWKKILVVVGIAYIFIPIEVIPDFILPFGIIDDLTLWVCILYLLKDTLDSYWIGEKPKDYSKKYKDTLEVDFEIKDDSQKENEENGSTN